MSPGQPALVKDVFFSYLFLVLLITLRARDSHLVCEEVLSIVGGGVLVKLRKVMHILGDSFNSDSVRHGHATSSSLRPPAETLNVSSAFEKVLILEPLVFDLQVCEYVVGNHLSLGPIVSTLGDECSHTAPESIIDVNVHIVLVILRVQER